MRNNRQQQMTNNVKQQMTNKDRLSKKRIPSPNIMLLSELKLAATVATGGRVKFLLPVSFFHKTKQFHTYFVSLHKYTHRMQTFFLNVEEFTHFYQSKTDQLTDADAFMLFFCWRK